MFENKVILALGAHPDDIEFSSGASINRLATEGNNTIYYAAFSPCIKSLPQGSEEDILYKEMKNAALVLGINSENVFTYNFPVREFTSYRQDILEELIKLKRKIKPDLVFIPRSTDIHQDHNVIYNEGLRAFKNSTLLGYELPWNNITSHNNFFIKLHKQNMESKLKAINKYNSQDSRFYKSADFYYGLARVRGTQIGVEYAEAFELIRGII